MSGLIICLHLFARASEITSPLRNLIRNNSEFRWEFEQEDTLIKIKEIVCNAPVLIVFNPSHEIIMQCDSSKDGLGACLLQRGQPVSFMSRSPSEAKKNYAQIEK